MAKFVTGGERLKKFSRQWGRGGAYAVKVGFFKTARYQGGIETRGSAKTGNLRSRKRKPHPVALVAAWNEFGTKSKSGKTITPERPFFRNTIRDPQVRKSLVAVMKKGIDAKKGVMTTSGAERVGHAFSGHLKREIRDLREPPNSERTIKWKESNNPLIDTGLMRTSVTHQVIQDPNK